MYTKRAEKHYHCGHREDELGDLVLNNKAYDVRGVQMAAGLGHYKRGSHQKRREQLQKRKQRYKRMSEKHNISCNQ